MVNIKQFLDDATPATGLQLHRTGSAKAGPQTAKLVPCGRSQWHGHHPANEPCPLCGPGQAASPVAEPEWIVHIDSGCVYDLTRFSAGAAKNMRDSYDYMPLQHVRRDTQAAKRICGCYFPPYTCERYADDRNMPITACSMPSVVKDPKWRKV